MPAEADQAAALFWFRIDTPSPSFPFGTQLATDAAIFFANTLGFTASNINGAFYVHAYLLTNTLIPLTSAHGFAPYPFAHTPPDFLPAMASITVHHLDTDGLRVPRSHFAAPARSIWNDRGGPAGAARSFFRLRGAIFAMGWSSQGRHFTPVSVSYKGGTWQDVSGWDIAAKFGGRLRRQQARRSRVIGNIPKILP